MAQQKNNYAPRNSSGIKTSSRNMGYYTNGSAARKLNDNRYNESTKNTRVSPKHSKKTSTGIDVKPIISSIAIIGILGVMLFQYIKLNSEVNALNYSLNKNSQLLYNLEKSNDEYLERIEGNINLEEIREQAINEWGMTYAKKEQIVFYESHIDDYVHSIQIVK